MANIYSRRFYPNNRCANCDYRILGLVECEIPSMVSRGFSIDNYMKFVEDNSEAQRSCSEEVCLLECEALLKANQLNKSGGNDNENR